MPDADETTGDITSPEGQEPLLPPEAGSADEATGDGAEVPEAAESMADEVGAESVTEQTLAEAPQQHEAPEPLQETEQEGASEDPGIPESDGSSDSHQVADDAEPQPVYELDAVLAASEDRAREALADITPADTIGRLVATLAQGDHVVSLQFANLMRGYPGWLWTATLSRIDETEDVNVLEVELLPGEGSVLAPDWVPWTDRLADYRAAQDAAGEAIEGSDDEESDEDDEDEDADSEDEFDDQVVLDADEDDSDDDDSDDDDPDEDDDESDEDDDDDSDDDDDDDDDRDDDDR